ncbi:MAG: hypothetical protein ABH879_05855, partial [archaeon]
EGETGTPPGWTNLCTESINCKIISSPFCPEGIYCIRTMRARCGGGGGISKYYRTFPSFADKQTYRFKVARSQYILSDDYGPVNERELLKRLEKYR